MTASFRRLFVALLLLSLLLVQFACGKEAQRDQSREQEHLPTAEAVSQPEPDGEKEMILAAQAYAQINAAHDVLDKMLTDIYEAWRWGIYEAEENRCSLSLLASELDRPVNELKRGYALISHESSWPDLSVGERQKRINSAEADFLALLKTGFSRFSACVGAVKGIYLENGSFAEANAYLNMAVQTMEQLHRVYPDSECYDPLKEYCLSETAIAEYCRAPTGSFEQAKTTVNDYRNTVRKLCAEMDLLIKDK